MYRPRLSSQDSPKPIHEKPKINAPAVHRNKAWSAKQKLRPSRTKKEGENWKPRPRKDATKGQDEGGKPEHAGLCWVEGVESGRGCWSAWTVDEDGALRDWWACEL